MTVGLCLSAAWVIAFIWRGLPPPLNPLLWLMGLVHRISVVVVALNLFGLEFLLRILANEPSRLQASPQRENAIGFDEVSPRHMMARGGAARSDQPA